METKWREIESFILKSGIRQGYAFSPYLLNIVPEVLARVTRQLREIKGIQIRRVEDKITLFADDMVVHICT